MTIAEIQRSIRAEIDQPLVDDSVDTTSVVDESVAVTVINEAPEPEPEPVAVEAHCEHCAAHAEKIGELEGIVAALTLEQAEPEPEPVPEPEPEEPVKEEVEPHREHFLNRRLGGGGE